MDSETTRRNFIKSLGVLGLGAVGIPWHCKGKKIHRIKQVSKLAGLPDASFVVCEDIYKAVESAISAIGGEQGIGQFISRGDVVVIKPNIGWTRAPELAANTNPYVVKKLIELCYNAGAVKVKVTDVSTHSALMSYKASGIEKVCKEMGADLVYPDASRFKTMKFPNGEAIKEWKVFLDVYETDKLINVPIAKHHNLAKLTVGMKNLYGAIGGVRSKLHQNIHISIVDLADFFKPTLTIVDAIRIMTQNGPTGGSLSDVDIKNTIIASTNQVAADSLATTLFDIEPDNFPILAMACKRGLGEYSIKKLNVKRLVVN